MVEGSAAAMMASANCTLCRVPVVVVGCAASGATADGAFVAEVRANPIPTIRGILHLQKEGVSHGGHIRYAFAPVKVSDDLQMDIGLGAKWVVRRVVRW